MAIPLLVIGGIAAAGAIAGAQAHASKAGQNIRHAGSFQETPYYDPNAKFFGGTREGLSQYTSNLYNRGYNAEQRTAPQAATYGAQYSSQVKGLRGSRPASPSADYLANQSLQARAQQGQVADMMRARASGQTPSIASQQAGLDQQAIQQGAQQQIGLLQQGSQNQIGLLQQNAENQMRQSMAQQAAQQSSARGAAGVALAQQGAANNTANTNQQIGRDVSQQTGNIGMVTAQQTGNIGMSAAQAGQNVGAQAQVNAANERMAAEQAAFGAYGNMRGGDVSSQAQAAQQAQYNAGLQQQTALSNAQLELASRNANDQRVMGYEELDSKARLAQYQGQLINQQTLAQSHAAAEVHNAARAQANADKDKGLMGSMFSGAMQGMSLGAMGSDERMKVPLARGGAGAFKSPGQAKRPLSTNEMLDDRWSQNDPWGYGGDNVTPRFGSAGPDVMPKAQLDAAMVAQVEQDRANAAIDRKLAEQAATARAPNDPAVKLGQAPKGYAAMRAAQMRNDEGGGGGGEGFASDGKRLAPGTGDFERTQPKAEKPWWMQPANFSSDEDAKKPVDLGDVEDWNKDDPFRPAPSVAEAVAAKQREGRRDPKSFARHDTGAEKRRIKRASEDKAGRDADAMMAGWRASLARGASVTRDEGDLDNEPTNGPAPWLTAEMERERGDSRTAFTSDDRAKLAQAWDDGHSAAVSDAEKLSRKSPYELKALAKSNPMARAVAGSKADAWDEGDRSSKPSKDDPFAKPGATLAAAPRYEVQAGPEDVAPPIEVPVAPAVNPLPPPKAPPMEPAAAPPPAATNGEEWYGRVPRLANWGEYRGVNRPTPRRQRPMTSDEDAKLSLDRGGRGVDRGAVADSNRTLVGTPYAYRPEHTPEHEQPGQPHFGFMTQNLRKSPIARVAVEKDPETGLDQVDRDRMLQVVAAGVADLQRQQDETRLALRRGGKRRAA